MSVKVDEVIGVAGFVVPGTRVDLVVTLRGTGQTEETMSRTVLSNVLVLTAGTKFDQEQAKDGKAQPSSVVTLAVSPNTPSGSRWPRRRERFRWRFATPSMLRPPTPPACTSTH